MKTMLLIIAMRIITLSLPITTMANYYSINTCYVHSYMNTNNISTNLDDGKLDGINIKYRYEWNHHLSLIGSLTHMNAKAYTKYIANQKYQVDARYRYNIISLTAGPIWRFNKFLSMYSVIGINYDNYIFKTSHYSYLDGNLQIKSHSGFQIQKASLAYGTGMQINLVQHIVVDMGYEASYFNHDSLTISRNSLLIGVGYCF